MDPDIAELKVSVARIEAKTEAILQAQQDSTKALLSHEERDREDFASVHSELRGMEKQHQNDFGKVNAKTNKIIGVGTGVVSLLSLMIAYFKNGGST